MTKELVEFENAILKPNGQRISNLTIERECKDYDGLNFQIDNVNFKYRKAKITPKKIGQFTSLWKRNSKKQTEPFNEIDDFDFCIIMAKQQNNFGFFLFPKVLLCENQILTTHLKEGKRGFRVYPNWTETNNKQSKKTQIWQTKYFIDLTNVDADTIKRCYSIWDKAKF